MSIVNRTFLAEVMCQHLAVGVSSHVSLPTSLFYSTAIFGAEIFQVTRHGSTGLRRPGHVKGSQSLFGRFRFVVVAVVVVVAVGVRVSDRR